MTDAPSTTTPAGDEDEMTAAERQAAARDAYVTSVRAGTPLTGAELGRRFHRTDRWGRMQIVEARAELDSGNGPFPSPGPNGNGTPASRVSDGMNRDDQTEGQERDATEHRAEPAGSRRNGSTRPTPSQAEPAGAARRPPGQSPTATPSPTDRLPMALIIVRWLTTLTVLAIALAAGRASYDHQRAFAEMAGEDRNAWSLPLSVDGMMIVASLTMLVRRWQNKPAGQLAWAALLLGGFASLGANITVAEPTLAGRLAAAWPPVCLLVSIELLLQQIREGRQRWS